MTREQLEKYHDIMVRLKTLQTEIVTDSVKGSSNEYPYINHSVTLHGIRRDEKARKEEELLERDKKAIDEFIDGVKDVRTRMLLDMKYRQSLSWKEIEAQTGGSHNADLKYLQRFFKLSNHVHKNPDKIKNEELQRQL